MHDIVKERLVFNYEHILSYNLIKDLSKLDSSSKLYMSSYILYIICEINEFRGVNFQKCPRKRNFIDHRKNIT